MFCYICMLPNSISLFQQLYYFYFYLFKYNVIFPCKSKSIQLLKKVEILELQQQLISVTVKKLTVQYVDLTCLRLFMFSNDNGLVYSVGQSISSRGFYTSNQLFQRVFIPPRIKIGFFFIPPLKNSWGFYMLRSDMIHRCSKFHWFIFM